MSITITPSALPNPRACIAWDGTDFYNVKCDGYGRLTVRGEDQLFSYSTAELDHETLSAAGGTDTIDSVAVASGNVYIITAISAEDETNAITSLEFWINDGMGNTVKLVHAASPGAGELVKWTGQIFLDAGMYIEAIYDGTTASDALDLYVAGYAMTKG